MTALEITADNFAETVRNNPIVFLDFWASWCPPCRAFAPVFEKASDTHADIKWGKVNTDKERELAAGFNITSIPTLMVFRDGILLFSQPGAMPGPMLEELVTQIRALDMDQVRREIEEHEHEQASG